MQTKSLCIRPVLVLSLAATLACSEDADSAGVTTEDSGTTGAGAPTEESATTENGATTGESGTTDDGESTSGTDGATEDGDEDELDLRKLHDGFWVLTFPIPNSDQTVESIADLHVNLETGRFTIYAQNRMNGAILDPPQLGPLECEQTDQGVTVCYHPNAVYLNGSGQELYTADGTGSWWVRHSWVDGGAPYLNCPLQSAETYDCINTTGAIQEDGLTKILRAMGIDNFNERVPMIDEDPITYRLIQHTPEPQPALFYECTQEASALTNEVRPCPTVPQ